MKIMPAYILRLSAKNQFSARDEAASSSWFPGYSRVDAVFVSAVKQTCVKVYANRTGIAAS